MIELSEITNRLIDEVIPSEHRERIRVRLRLEVSESIPNGNNHPSEEIDRIRFSNLRLLHESKMELEDYAFKIAYVDWRDLLMAAHHGHDIKAHLKWADAIFNVVD